MEIDPRVSNKELDKIHKIAIKAGALGGKILGTGGGGYFIFYVPPFSRYSVMDSLKKKGFHPEGVLIDQEGLCSWWL